LTHFPVDYSLVKKNDSPTAIVFNNVDDDGTFRKSQFVTMLSLVFKFRQTSRLKCKKWQ